MEDSKIYRSYVFAFPEIREHCIKTMSFSPYFYTMKSIDRTWEELTDEEKLQVLEDRDE